MRTTRGWFAGILSPELMPGTNEGGAPGTALGEVGSVPGCGCGAPGCAGVCTGPGAICAVAKVVPATSKAVTKYRRIPNSHVQVRRVYTVGFLFCTCVLSRDTGANFRGMVRRATLLQADGKCERAGGWHGVDRADSGCSGSGKSRACAPVCGGCSGDVFRGKFCDVGHRRRSAGSEYGHAGGTRAPPGDGAGVRKARGRGQAVFSEESTDDPGCAARERLRADQGSCRCASAAEAVVLWKCGRSPLQGNVTFVTIEIAANKS